MDLCVDTKHMLPISNVKLLYTADMATCLGFLASIAIIFVVTPHSKKRRWRRFTRWICTYSYTPPQNGIRFDFVVISKFRKFSFNFNKNTILINYFIFSKLRIFFRTAFPKNIFIIQKSKCFFSFSFGHCVLFFGPNINFSIMIIGDSNANVAIIETNTVNK